MTAKTTTTRTRRAPMYFLAARSENNLELRIGPSQTFPSVKQAREHVAASRAPGKYAVIRIVDTFVAAESRTMEISSNGEAARKE